MNEENVGAGGVERVMSGSGGGHRGSERGGFVLQVDSCAKINLGLHVLERLPNGFHRIETGYCFIDWLDRITMRPAPQWSLTMSEESIPTDERNLVTRAYRVFEREVGCSSAYRVEVVKRIPAGAGLGGGSGNAAAMLRLLNHAEGAGLSTGELVELSRGLGSDIALFLWGRTGLASGTGQEIEPLELQPQAWIVTVWPGFGSATAEAYAMCEPEPNPILPLRSILTEEPLEEWPVLLVNDLEPPVVARYDMVGLMKAQMEEFGAVYASMSGSGSAVFGLFEQEFVARHAWESLRALGYAANLTPPGYRPDMEIRERRLR